MSTPSGSALGIFLPDRTLDYFVVTHWSKNDTEVRITLQERDEPPMTEGDKKIISKGFHDITITDFPIRGRRALLTFRRRYWQIEGEKKLLKRDIPLTFPGTQLETEFANFLKEKSRTHPDVARQYRGYALPPDQGV